MRLAIAILLLALTCNGQEYLQHRRTAFRTTATAASGLSKTSLFAWFDFDSAADAHSTYTLVESNAPAYTSGYGSSLASGTNCWRQSTIGSKFYTNNVDMSFVIRYRGVAGIVAGSFIVHGWNGRVAVRWYTTGNVVYFGLSSSLTLSAAVTNTWYCLIAQYTAADNSLDVWVNNGTVTEASGTSTVGSGALLIGRGTDATMTSTFDIDYLGFFNRLLTSDERTWLYNSGGTRTYSELSP